MTTDLPLQNTTINCVTDAKGPRVEILCCDFQHAQRLQQALGVARVASSPSSPVPAEQELRALCSERVAKAARLFCEELQEDAEGVPRLQLSEPNAALDAWEAYPDARDSFDDNQPVLAALASLVEDQHATDHQRRVAHLALAALKTPAATPAPVEQERDAHADLLALRQQVEDTIAVAQTDEDGDGFITAYHFKTGAIHRLLAEVRK